MLVTHPQTLFSPLCRVKLKKRDSYLRYNFIMYLDTYFESFFYLNKFCLVSGMFLYFKVQGTFKNYVYILPNDLIISFVNQ